MSKKIQVGFFTGGGVEYCKIPKKQVKVALLSLCCKGFCYLQHFLGGTSKKTLCIYLIPYSGKQEQTFHLYGIMFDLAPLGVDVCDRGPL